MEFSLEDEPGFPAAALHGYLETCLLILLTSEAGNLTSCETKAQRHSHDIMGLKKQKMLQYFECVLASPAQISGSIWTLQYW